MLPLDAQASAPPPAIQVLGAEAHFVSAAARDIPLVLTKAGRVENALVRYQIYIRGQVRATAVGGAPPLCEWILSSQLQRQICFTSMTGLLACTDTNPTEQSDKQTGQTQLASGADAPSCGLAYPGVVDAELKLAQILHEVAPVRFESDLKLNVLPPLIKAGATVKRGK